MVPKRLRIIKLHRRSLDASMFLLALSLLTLLSSAVAVVDVLRPTMLHTATTDDQTKIFQFNCLAGENATAKLEPTAHQSAIGLQVTSDPIHQIITRIFALMLKEKFHYHNVTLVPLQFWGNQTEYKKLVYTFEQLRNSNNPGMAMINVGLWMPPNGHAMLPPEIYDVGSSMPSGRFGWFVPTDLLTNFTEEEENLDYKIFLDMEHPEYKSFIINEDILQDLKTKTGGEFFVSSKCFKKQCATLLAGDPQHTAFIKEQINETGSYINVLWLGDQFKQTLLHLYTKYHENKMFNGSRFLVLHWTPSDIINDRINYSSIVMPRCEEFTSLYDSFCKYELTPILKYFTKSLDVEVNSKVMSALRAFHFKTADREFLLSELERLENKNVIRSVDVYNNAACSWLKRNNDNKWTINEPMTLSIGGIFPIMDTSRGHQNLVPAVQDAVSAVTKNGSILNNYNFKVLINDGQCRADIVMKAFIHYFNIPNVIGVLGPACSETVEPIAGISQHTKLAVISYSAEGASFIDRVKYPYIFRTIGSNRQYEDVYINIMRQLKWKRVAALTEDGQKYTEYISHMEANMKQMNLELIINKKFYSTVTAAEMNKYLADLKKRHAKIIIADIHNRNAELALCEAYKLGMTAHEGYVWFLPPWLSKDWDLLSKRNNNSCTSEQLRKAYEGHFTILHTAFGNHSTIMQEGITIGEWLSRYSSGNKTISNYVGFAYDAVWAYAIAADKLLLENPDAINNLRSNSVVNRFVELIWETDFEGLSGRVRFGKGGSRILDIDIRQWRKSQFVPVGKFYPKIVGAKKDLRIEGGELKLEESDIVWLSGNRPGDGTYDCGLSGLASFMDLDCDTTALVFTAMMCFLAVIIISLMSFIFWKRRYDSKLKRSAKIMKTFGIDLLSPSRNKSNTLDKWEIPKENVVVNRRLGEGAFGTVYGGEAQLKSEGWTAVAVKTLKAGASTEDRLDFLSEAEAMKRLDHKNIVKLLGVCLQSEPIYTVMEFMLYGDLKTYLLARRHMVNDKTTDESDICPKRLTMYAMDVARGLAYLAQQKYVHRDLACRNCLVNAQRVVKLGDFGMARPTFESDYYRFNRKGMLPVRWMAPESLALGLFTPASDVWAFGVVVFEIITFGSFPFQGLTNNQVLEYVKSGNTLEIPVDAKPQLETIIRNCWNQDIKKRPTAADIVDYISNHPRLLTPCLDYPGAAVAMPETESDEFELLPRGHVSSAANPDSTLDILAPTRSVSNFERTRALIDSMNLSDTNSVHNDLQTTTTPDNALSIDTFSPTTPDGYSIMSPLLMHQANENREALQTRPVRTQQTPF